MQETMEYLDSFIKDPTILIEWKTSPSTVVSESIS